MGEGEEFRDREEFRDMNEISGFRIVSQEFPINVR
jgi:hypothetical protein